MIMFQRIDLPTLEAEYSPDPIPNKLYLHKLPNTSTNQVVFFDETHIQQDGGRVSRDGVQIRLPRDANGGILPPVGRKFHNSILKN